MIVISKHLLRLSAVLVVAMGASACSSIPDWVDPTTWGSSDQQASVPPDDQSGNQTATDQNGDGKTVAEASDTGAAYPTLADTPDHAPQTTSSDEQKQVASGLVADRSQAQYSADALRGGTEAAAPPPGPPPTAEQVAAAEAQASASASSSTQASGAAPAGPDTDTTANPNSTIDANPDQAPSATATAQAATPSDTSANTQVAAVEQPTAPTAPPPSSNAEPAVPAIAPGSMAAAPMASADASLGFRRSSAPPLDPSIAQFVPPSVLSRYQQTASAGAVPGIGSSPASAYTAATPRRVRTARHRTVSENVGGPESMSGAVVANFESLQSAKSAAVYSDSSGMPPAAVVFFPHDTTVLDAQGRAQVRQAVEAFRAHGGQAFIRVVGHSSSRTANMTVERHMVYNFERSQARANSVARALIAAGVPADKVLVEAVGDTQPVYYESMPQGEEGNRRAEIFLQS